MKLKKETKIAATAGICMFLIAIISAIVGKYPNPIILAVPGYMLVIHVILKEQFNWTCKHCALNIIAGTLVVIALFLL